MGHPLKAAFSLACAIALGGCGGTLERKDFRKGADSPDGRGVSDYKSGFPLDPFENPSGAISLDQTTRGLQFLPSLATPSANFLSHSFEMPKFKLAGFAVSPLEPYGMELPANQGTEHFDKSNVTMTGNKLYVRLNEGAGAVTFQDSSGSNLGGTCGPCPNPVQGVFKNGQSFTGSQTIQYNLPSPDPLNFSAQDRFGISVWVSLAGVADGAHVLRKHANGDYTIHYSGGKLCGSFRSVVSGVAVRKSACSTLENDTSGKLHHVVVSYDKTVLRLYIDGTETASVSTNLGVTNSGPTFSVGSNFKANYWSGIIDELAVFDRPLTAQEVDALYVRGASRYAFQIRWGNSLDELLSRPFVGPAGQNSYFNPTEFPSDQAPILFPTPGVEGTWFQFKGYFLSDAVDTPVIIKSVAPLLQPSL